MMNWLQRFFYGRNGSDALGFASLILSMILSLVGRIFGLEIVWLLSILPLIYTFFRMMSRNVYARRRENEKFMQFVGPPLRKTADAIRNWNIRRKDTAHRYFKCPRCKQRVRVPAGRGKIRIICPKCRNEFIKKS